MRSAPVDHSIRPSPDAAGILEWVSRLKLINRWHADAIRDGRISGGELEQLHQQTGITHLIASRMGPVEIEPAYRNANFSVYRIGAL